jgi:hypothetical protein
LQEGTKLGRKELVVIKEGKRKTHIKQNYHHELSETKGCMDMSSRRKGS